MAFNMSTYNTRQRTTAMDENMTGVSHAKGFNDRKPAAKRSALGDISNATAGVSGMGLSNGNAKSMVQIAKKQTTLRARSNNNVSNHSNQMNNDLTAVAAAAAAAVSKSQLAVGTEVIQLQQQHQDAAGPMLIDNTPRAATISSQQQQQQQNAAGVAAASSNSSGSSEVAGAPVQDWEDIDVYDEDDAQCCTEYVEEIFQYMRQKEVAEAVNPDYLSLQRDINSKMRGILLDWMVDVHLKFKLLSETMFLSVSVIDRYLSMHQVPRHRLQLVGITAMLIGSKFEEIWAPEVRDFVYICDRAFTREEILELEVQMLNSLDFSLTPPTALGFLRRFSKAARSDSRTHTLSKYLTELTLPDYGMLRFRPSCVAAAAVFVARSMVGLTPAWNPTLRHYTAQSVDDIRDCCLALNDLLKSQASASLKATTRKYSSSKLLKVATIAPVELNFS